MNLKDMLTIDEYQELAKKLPVVVRVHSENHPELMELGKVFAELLLANNDDVKACLKKMEEISNGFKVPEDACPTYARVYELLSKVINV